MYCIALRRRHGAHHIFLLRLNNRVMEIGDGDDTITSTEGCPSCKRMSRGISRRYYIRESAKKKGFNSNIDITNKGGDRPMQNDGRVHDRINDIKWVSLKNEIVQTNRESTRNQSGQFRTISVETPKIFHSGTPPGTRNTTEMYILIFRGVLGYFSRFGCFR
jgi:hypothetical protein